MGNYELSYSYILKCESWQIYGIPLNNLDILKIKYYQTFDRQQIIFNKTNNFSGDEVAPSVCQNYSKFGWLCICENRNKSWAHNQIFVEYCYPNNWECASQEEFSFIWRILFIGSFKGFILRICEKEKENIILATSQHPTALSTATSNLV